jgi:hypothetical protein
LSKYIATGGDSANDTVTALFNAGAINVINKTQTISDTVGGALLEYKIAPNATAKNSFIHFGQSSPGSSQLWEYHTIRNSFEEVNLEIESTASSNPNATQPDLTVHHGASAVSPDGVAYYLGGINSQGKYVPQLVKFDMNSGDVTAGRGTYRNASQSRR